MDILRIKKRRSAHKAVITRQLGKLEEYAGDNTHFTTVIETLRNKLMALEEINEEIMSQVDEVDMETEMLETEDYMLEVRLRIGDLEAQHRAAVEITRSPQITLENTTLEEPLNSNNHETAQPVHRIAEGTSGNRNNSTSANNKFCYLKTLLSDDAASVIDGLNVTHGNYSEAIHLLKERFGQTHKVVNAYMQGLLDLPRPTSQLSSLRPFQEKMEAYIRGLQSLGQGHESFGNLLIPVILEKLPAEIKRNMTRDHGGSEWRLPELRRALKKEINIIDSGQPTQTTYEHLATASFLTSTRPTQKKKCFQHIQEVQIPQRPQCPFCSEKHFANDCKNIINPRERKAIIHRKKLCFNCLGKHIVASCRSKHRCRKCNRKHHTSICDQSIGSSLNTSAPSFVPTSGSEATTHLTSGSSAQSAILHSATQSRNNVLLKTAVAEVTSGHACAKANILFDEGAQRSFITHELAETLQLQRRGSEVVHLAAFGAESKKVGHFETATVYLITENSEKIAIDVLIVPSIAVPLRNQIQAATHLPYLRGLKLAHPVPEVDTFNISLLIGADRYWEIIGDRIIRGDGPTAVQSKIGFLLSGPLPVTSSSKATNYIMNIITSAPDYDDLERFWKLESIGILPAAEEKASDYLHNYQKNCITFENDKYTASLPWKPDHPNLPDNYNITLRRTQNTIRRLREDPPLLQKYDGIIKDQEKGGFIEKVNVLPSERPVHYIPHHGVKKHSATTPIRIVFDCSCRQNKNSPSLNDCLESTPPEINELTSILVNFRKHRYAVCTENEKAYICLFTCASTRAVHLEVVSDMTESSFLQAFRRFSSRKSLPKVMISDNGTTFQAAANTIRQLMNSTSVKDTLHNHGTEWRFIPMRAPWFGGWWERLIGLTKTAIKKVLGSAYVTYDTLQTIVTEVESVMNDRPLTYVTSESTDPEPITPAHLLYGRRLTTLPYNEDISEPKPVSRDGITKQARIQSQIISHFRDRWRHEYLTSLRQYHKTTGNNSQTIKVGDVVIIHDETPKSQWKLGTIEQLITGKDGLTRAAMVRTSNGHTTSRPIVKLYPLETM
ncbi:uncharacterized protein LOC132728821 [Ruditapes philippinarum]|uniref:uncharacterized protein LOC132728821 n=1 Tax=Ruditapes philippinarum TaxID=129788 RepID=UPI00295B5F11|nr:uncharacterized protein LOC132728821 [Ruditapes philippinarum]